MKSATFIRLFGIVMVIFLALSACSSADDTSAEKTKDNSTEEKAKDNTTEEDSSEKTKETEQTITYLDKEYTVPNEITKIATASLESMEDAAVLGVKPIGAITIGDELPKYLAEELAGAESIGDKRQPNYETLLSMKPDVILGTSKFQPEVVENLNKIATMFPVSHISTDWESNLRLLAELTNQTDKADEIINQYKADAAGLKESISDKLQDKKVLIARMRSGNVFFYPADVYFNPVLYDDLGIAIPDELKAIKAQEQISIEKLAEINPDYLFIQFAEDENAEKPEALKDLQSNPIWQSIQAVKDEHVFVNSVDPMAQGGTAWSKIAFLDAAKEALSH